MKCEDNRRQQQANIECITSKEVLNEIRENINTSKAFRIDLITRVVRKVIIKLIFGQFYVACIVRKF